MREHTSSKIVKTVERTTQEVAIPANASIEEREYLFNHLLNFCVAITGADPFEIAENIYEKNGSYFFEESCSITGNDLNPLAFENIVEID